MPINKFMALTVGLFAVAAIGVSVGGCLSEAPYVSQEVTDVLYGPLVEVPASNQSSVTFGIVMWHVYDGDDGDSVRVLGMGEDGETSC